jgi:hypothetical protein
MSTDTLLAERSETHGRFADNAGYAQALRTLWRSSPAWERMLPEHREALDMLACKFSRILSGQSDSKSHWEDVAGYAVLAERACKR